MIQNKISRYTLFLLFFIAGNVYSNTLLAIESGTLYKQFQKIEQKNDSHIGLSAIDMSNNNQLSYNGDKRISMQCTAKVMGVATILNQNTTNANLLNERIFYKSTDLVPWSPVTAKHVKDGMTVKELCIATLEYSDNTAINLLVTKMGGLQNMNKFARQIGNNSFRQDDIWPKEADDTPENIKNTSTPNDMAASLQKLLFTNVLPQEQRKNLITWLKQCKTGDNRIRSGIPHGWIAGDKTGTGSYYGITNDLGVVWPPHCAPIIIAIYYYADQKNAKKNERVLGQVTKLVINQFAKNNQCLNKDLKDASHIK